MNSPDNCPTCGQKPIFGFASGEGPTQTNIGCSSCNLSPNDFKVYPSIPEANDAWNDFVAPQRVEALRNAYDGKREAILAKIRSGMSASLSGIEWYPKPWAELSNRGKADVLCGRPAEWNPLSSISGPSLSGGDEN